MYLVLRFLKILNQRKSCWLLAFGCWQSKACDGCWLLAFGYWQRKAYDGYWPLALGNAKRVMAVGF